MSIREIINNLIDHDIASMLYYDHEERPFYYSDVFSTEYDIPHYDGKDEFYDNYEPCIELAGSGDYVGSTIDMANRRFIENEYPELFESGGIMYRSQGYGYESLVIFFLRPSVIRSKIFDELENLPDYCLLDDELHSVIEDELLDQSWDDWLGSEFESELEKLTGVEFYNTRWQSNLFWEILRNGNGSEYFPEGINIYVDMKEVFNDSDSFIDIIKEHAELLDTGEYEIYSEWKPVGYRLSFDYSYKGNTSWGDRQHMFNLHMKNTKVDTIPNTILKEFGLKWVSENKLFWEVKPINAPLKHVLKKGVSEIFPLDRLDEDCDSPNPFIPCVNCNQDSVMTVKYGDFGIASVCPNCYNKLMSYWPKCQHCNVKNVNASLQSTLLPDLEDSSNLTHCKECKNLICGV